MSPSKALTARQRELETLAEPVCTAHGVELVEVRQVQGRGALVVRVTIDRPRPASDTRPGSGVTVDDCKAVSRDLSTALDVHDELIGGQYHLEVSSPGLDRPLVRPADYVRFAGQDVKLKLSEGLPGSEKRKSYTGRLIGLRGAATPGDAPSAATVPAEVEDPEVLLEVAGKTLSIPLRVVSRAQLVPRFDV